MVGLAGGRMGDAGGRDGHLAAGHPMDAQPGAGQPRGLPLHGLIT